MLAGRAAITSRPFLAGAAILTTGTTIYYTTRPSPIRYESSMATKTVIATQTTATELAGDVRNAPKKTFTGMLSAKELKVTKVEQLNHDTKRITFQLPSDQEVSGLVPSAAILTQHTPPGKWIPVFRPYTPIQDIDKQGVLQLVVKKYPNGRASGHLHSLEPGSSLWVRGPLPGYNYKPSSSDRNVLLLAGGAGITPIYSLAKGILSNQDDKTRIHLLWGVNGTRDIVLGEELSLLEKQFPNRFEVTYAVSGPETKADVPLLRDEKKYRPGYVSKDMIEEAIQTAQKGSFGDEKGTKIFICGPPAFEEALAGKKGLLGLGSKPGATGELGVASSEVHKF